MKNILYCITEICHDNTYAAYFISYKMKTTTFKTWTLWKAYRGVQVPLAVHCQIQLGLNSLDSHYSKTHRDEVKQSWNPKECENNVIFLIPQLSIYPAGLSGPPKVMCLVRKDIYLYTYRYVGPLLLFSIFDSCLQSHNGGYNYIFLNPLEKMEENSMVCIVLEVGNLNISKEMQFRELVYILSSFILNKLRF